VLNALRVHSSRAPALQRAAQILLVGDSGVGKSSLLLRFATGGFEEVGRQGLLGGMACRHAMEHGIYKQVQQPTPLRLLRLLPVTGTCPCPTCAAHRRTCCSWCPR